MTNSVLNGLDKEESLHPIPAVISKEISVPSKIFSGEPWIIVSATFVLAAAATFAGIYFYTTSLTASSMRGMLSHMVSDASLNMQVAGRDDRLIVSWNRQMPAVRSARYGVLSIDDGAKHRDINLLPNEVAKGSILYKHVSDDVTFRLEIHNGEGPPITGMVRVLDGSTLAAPAVTNTKQLSRTPTNNFQFAVERREQRPSTKANPAKLAFGPANLVQPNGVVQETSLPQIRVDTNQAAASLPLSLIAAEPPDFAPSQNSRETSQIGAIQKFPSPRQAVESPQPRKLDATTLSPYVPPYIPPRPLKQVMPNTRVYGSSVIRAPMQIEVQIKINENGRVVDAFVPKTRTSASRSPLAFPAIAAAKQWVFEPARMHGRNVPSDFAIRFSFRPEAR
jgi:hypothetical protein